LACVLLTGLAAAEEGYKASVTSEVKLTDEFVRLAAQSAGGAVPDLTAADLRVEPVNAVVYWTHGKLRMDSTIPLSGVVVTTLVDFDAQQYIVVNHQLRLAWAVSFASFKELEKELGLPVDYPDEVFLMWDDVQASLRALPHMQVRDLGTKQINGETCRGLAFSGRIEDVVKADGFTPVQTIAPLKDLHGKWTGEYWLAERLGLPVKMDMRMLGVQYVWTVDRVEPWTPIEYLLRVPPGYRTEEVPASLIVQALTLQSH
jgi:hypothetical protein